MRTTKYGLLYCILSFILCSPINAQPIADSFQFPLTDWDNYISGGFGFGESNPNFSGYHLGQDTNVSRTPVDTPVFAAADGIVINSGERAIGGYGSDENRPRCDYSYAGYAVVIKHRIPDGSFVYTLYGHLQSDSNIYNETQQIGLIPSGSEVKKGQYIGRVAHYWHFTNKKCAVADWHHLHFGTRYDSATDTDYTKGYTTTGWLDLNHTVHKIWEDPNKFIKCHQNAVTNPTWEFNIDGNFECWRPWNVDDYSAQGGIFYIDPSLTDPYITSPPLSLPAQSSDSLEIRMASNAPDGIGAIYFTTDIEPGYSEDKKIQFLVTNDGQYYTYTIKVGEHAKWQGTVTGLRLDPASAGKRKKGHNSDTVGIDYIKLLSPVTAGSPWPMLGHDPQHTGQSPYNGPISPNPSLLWTYEFKEPYGSPPITIIGIGGGPAIGADGKVYVAAGYSGPQGILYAIDSDGSLKWRSEADVTGAKSPAIGPDGTVYIVRSLPGSGFNGLIAISKDSGQVIWSYTMTGPVGSAIVSSNGIILVGDKTGIFAIQPNGILKWKKDLQTMYYDSFANIGLSTDGNIITVASCPSNGNSSCIYSLGKDNGEIQWSLTLPQLVAGPVIDLAGSIYLWGLVSPPNQNFLYSISQAGVLNWQRDVSFYPTSLSIGRDGSLFFGTSDGLGAGGLYALSPLGDLKWFYPTGIVGGPPAIGGDGTIYFGSGKYPERNPGDSRITALKPDGTVLWEYLPPPVEGEETFYPAIGSDGRLYISGCNSLYAFSPNPISRWAKIFGGGGEVINAVRSTSDNGYILVGYTTQPGTNMDMLVMKISSEGNIVWQKSYGGGNDDHAYAVATTSDGGFIVAGDTSSFHRWVLKLDVGGNVQWQRSDEGAGNFYSMEPTPDGGFIFAGYYAGAAFVLKLDPAGNVQWEKTYGSGSDFFWSIKLTSDGGYIVAGRSYSFGTGVSADMWVVKLDGNGNIQWQKVYGSPAGEDASSIQVTSDGGYIMVGNAIAGAWVLKLSPEGNIQWQATYGGTGYSIQEAQGGGYIIGGNVATPGNSNTFRILKLDLNGNPEWEKTYGSGYAFDLEKTSGGGYIVGGVSYPSGGVGAAKVLKIDADGNIGNACGIIGTSSAFGTATYITPQNSAANSTSINTNFLATAAIPQDPALTVTTQCSFP